MILKRLKSVRREDAIQCSSMSHVTLGLPTMQTDSETNFTSTRSPIFSSLSPFLTEPLSDRLETDSLFVCAKLEEAAAAGVAEEAFLVAVELEGTVDLAAGV